MSIINDIKYDFNLFNHTSSVLYYHHEHYLPRFIYAACELWLCAEICHLVNFDGPGLQTLSDGDLFLYNEDKKRDLTLYSAGKTEQPEILLHIEVKVIYPPSDAKCKDAIDNLYQKLKTSFNPAYRQQGWVYLVWTEYYAEVEPEPEKFFKSHIDFIKEWLETQKFFDQENNLLKPHYSESRDIVNGTMTWRGDQKRVMVKAIAFSFDKNAE